MRSADATAICVDFGSTWTKASLVDLTAARIVATASHPTSLDTDVLDGFEACRDALIEADPRAADARVLACSSAGGGLRIAVVGNEDLVTAEAGRRVALSSGGKVVATVGRGGYPTLAATLAEAAPDVVLLTGGTDGGNAAALLVGARALATCWPGPVVVAGNVEARAEVSEVLAANPVVLADNVVPRIGVLEPGSARAAIREMFLAHVIGGKGLSRSDDFAAMVTGPTPDVVLTGVELLANGLDAERPGAGDVVVVDVGGATTDVHSVVEIDPEDRGLSREVVATSPSTRTVEGDLGMRWSAPSTVAAMERADLVDAAGRRHSVPGWVPAAHGGDADAEAAIDEQIAAGAVRIALQRHAGRSRVVLGPDGRVVERTGKDLREVDLLVGSGGVLRHGRPGVADRVLGPATGEDIEGGWQLPRRPRVVVDHDYVLAAVGLLAESHPDVAHELSRILFDTGPDPDSLSA